MNQRSDSCGDFDQILSFAERRPGTPAGLQTIQRRITHEGNKTLAGALALTMLASTAVSFQVSAADASVTLKGAKVEAEAGGAFSVDVSLADIPSTKINVMDFAVTYDNTVLNVDSVKIGKSADVDVSGDSTAADAPVFNTNIKDSEITVSWSTALGSASWIAEDGVILTISGTVKDDVKDGTVTPIDFAPVTRETYQVPARTIRAWSSAM